MIRIGLAGWGDHHDLYPDKEAARRKLQTYSEWFDTVELDSSFYAVQPERNMRKWAEETPTSFSFIVKAFQGMTGHARGEIPFASEDAMYDAFHLSLQPLQQAGKLAAVLFQYPPWFACTRENVAVLRLAKSRMKNVPCVLEFRHQSWFAPQLRERTLAFMRAEGWRFSVCDEPQAGEGSVPIVEAATDDEMTLVRFHGRNIANWQGNERRSGQSWREVRYLYRYSEEELEEWVVRLRRLEAMTKTVHVIFNNNSGGDAAANALQLMQMLGQLPPRGSFARPVPAGEAGEGDGPEQLTLF